MSHVIVARLMAIFQDNLGKPVQYQNVSILDLNQLETRVIETVVTIGAIRRGRH